MEPTTFPLQQLPVELSKDIISVAAISSRSAALNLSTTCQLLHEWTTPIIYHSVILVSDSVAQKLRYSVQRNPRLLDNIIILTIVCSQHLCTDYALQTLHLCRPRSLLMLLEHSKLQPRIETTTILAPPQIMITSNGCDFLLDYTQVRAVCLMELRAPASLGTIARQSKCLELIILIASHSVDFDRYIDMHINTRVRMVFLTGSPQLKGAFRSSKLARDYNAEVLNINLNNDSVLFGGLRTGEHDLFGMSSFNPSRSCILYCIPYRAGRYCDEGEQLI